MTAKTVERRQLEQQVKDLRAEWKAYQRADYRVLSHIDLCLAPCPDRCGRCEGCASAAWRQDRMDEIAVQAAALKRQLKDLAEPEPEPAEPEQLALLT